MTTLEAPLRSPVRHPARPIELAADDRESASFASFTLVQSIARVMLTLLLMVGMSALFASQIYATLR
jgi:hypothetical protein